LEPNRHDEPHVPGPSLWPIGFAIGVACVLVGLIVSWPAVAVGAAIAVVSAFLWIRDASRGIETEVVHEPERRDAVTGPAPPATAGDAAMPVMEDEEVDRYGRNVFLSATTLGLGAVIGGIVTVPVVGFMVAPAFIDQHEEHAKDVDLGPIENFPEGKFMIATFLRDPAQGEVTRRTAYIRNNGITNGVPSFTILSNRCAHLGCPVQPNGPIDDKAEKKFMTTKGEEVRLIPVSPAGFGCPCHGGQYDTEGTRTAGPPVRSLDRYEFAIVRGRLVLLNTFSVTRVEGTGASAKIHAYGLKGPGEHADGLESLLYPVDPPH
jgi:menaquinol-cytochrome c reductase iron-sulfur subunit